MDSVSSKRILLLGCLNSSVSYFDRCKKPPITLAQRLFFKSDLRELCPYKQPVESIVFNGLFVFRSFETVYCEALESNIRMFLDVDFTQCNIASNI